MMEHERIYRIQNLDGYGEKVHLYPSRRWSGVTPAAPGLWLVGLYQQVKAPFRTFAWYYTPKTLKSEGHEIDTARYDAYCLAVGITVTTQRVGRATTRTITEEPTNARHAT